MSVYIRVRHNKTSTVREISVYNDNNLQFKFQFFSYIATAIGIEVCGNCNATRRGT
jgi:hypothetical protein